MRIIGGEFRSRRLQTPKDALTTRPIPDRVKESLFSLLRGHMEDAVVFDAFAGTGAIGLEALSRGAARCVFVERERTVAAILKQNIEALGVEDRAELVVGDALGPGALARCPRPVTLAFMDPPYPLVREALGWRRVKLQMERLIALLTDDGFAVLRTPWPHMIEEASEETGEAGEGGEDRRRSARLGRKNNVERDDTSDDDVGDQFSVGVGDEEDDGARGRGRRKLKLRREEDVEEEEEAKPGIVLTPADQSIPGADGPETHVYHNMAVHLYAKKRGGE